MQAIAPDSAQSLQTDSQSTSELRVVVTLEFILYAILIFSAFFFRIAELDSVSITESEIGQALSTYRIVLPESSGTTIAVESPSVFVAQTIAMTLLGGNELSARVLTALASLLLIASPLLFRDVLGRVRAFVIALLLVFSPVIFTASRLSSGMIWASLFLVLALWGLKIFWSKRHSDDASSANFYGVLVILGFAGMIFLSDAGGVILALIVGFALLASAVMSIVENPDDNEDFMQQDRVNFYSLLTQLPWVNGILASGIMIVTVSTLFMIYPSGLNAVSNVLDNFVRGFVESNPDAPFLYPLITSIFYEPWLWIFSTITIVMLASQSRLTFIERFFAIWLAGAFLLSLVYQGGSAQHAIWLILPLIGLTSLIMADALDEDNTPTLWIGDLLDDDDLATNSARWGKWALAFVMFALMVMLSIHFQVIVRGFLDVDGGTLGNYFNRLGDSSFNLVTNSLIWLLITGLFISVGYFLGASIWGHTTTVRAGTLGLFAFVLMSGLGTGWNTAISRADSATELWYPTATHEHASVLRDVLGDFALRETQGEPDLPIAVLAPDDGVLAWLLRDFQNATYINTVSEAYQQQVVLVPDYVEPPVLGASYVGQVYTLNEIWQLHRGGLDILPWWITRDVRVVPQPLDRIALWVRQDIFHSDPFLPVFDDAGGRG